MPVLLDITIETLAESIRGARRALTAEYRAINLSAFLRTNLLYPLGVVLGRMRAQFNIQLREQSSQAAPFGATGANLDRYLELYSIQVPPASIATGSVELTGQNNAVVPALTELTFNGLIYTTDDQVVFGAGESTIEVDVTAAEVGADYNRDAGELLDLAFLVDDVDPTAVVVTLSGGNDEANDDTKAALLQARFAQSRGRGTASDYRAIALRSDSRFVEAFIVPSGQGPGTVSVYPINRLDPGQETWEVSVPSAGQIADLQVALDAERLVNDVIHALTITKLDLTFDVTIDPDDAATREAVEDAIGERLAEDYQAGGYTIANSEISAAIGNAPGVASHTLNDVNGEGPSADVVALVGELANLLPGGVTFS